MQVCRGGEVHGLRDAEVQRCRARCRRSAEIQRCIDADADVQECSRCADVEIRGAEVHSEVQLCRCRNADLTQANIGTKNN